MNDIDNNVTLNDSLSKKIQLSLHFIIESLQKTKFQYTGKALISFIPKSGYLINSILFSCKNMDSYSASILFRSLIEHSFKHLYIFVRALNDNNDSVGETYYKSLKGYEDLKSIQKIINYNKLVYPENTQWNTKSEHNKTLGGVARKFDIGEIFQYLIKNNNIEKSKIFEKYKKEYLLERLTEYTNMSSSVHGGPFGELVLYGLQKDKSKLGATLNKFANESFMLHKSIVETTYLFASLIDEELTKYYNDIVSK